MLSSPLSARSQPEHFVAPTPYAELHCHTNFSFLDGASAPDDLVERAVELGLSGLAVTASAQSPTPSPADGPWSGQVQCVLSARGPDYQDDQTHTWRLTGEKPLLVGLFRRWPAMWSVVGSGSRPSETWKTTVPETSAPIAVWEPAAGRIRFGSQHGLLSVNGGITGTASTRAAINAPFQEMEFPVVEDAATLTTISGTRTRMVPGHAWRQPLDVLTTETCTWNYVKGGSPATQISSATGTTISAPTLRAAGPAGTIATIEPAPAPASIGGRQASEIKSGTGAGVTARLAWPPREITLPGFTAEGSFAAVPARTLTLPGFTAGGEFTPIPPRTITLTGWTATGP